MKEKVKVWLLQDRLVAEAISRESANSEKLARAKPPQVFFFNKEKSKELDLCLTLYFWVV